MKLISYLLLLLSAAMGIAAVDVQKSFLVSFDKAVSDDVVNTAKQMIKDAKGQITHEYSLIKYDATPHRSIFLSFSLSLAWPLPRRIRRIMLTRARAAFLFLQGLRRYCWGKGL